MADLEVGHRKGSIINPLPAIARGHAIFVFYKDEAVANYSIYREDGSEFSDDFKGSRAWLDDMLRAVVHLEGPQREAIIYISEGDWDKLRLLGCPYLERVEELDGPASTWRPL